MSPKTKANVAKPKRPTYEDMIYEAIVALKERKGSSRQAIKKYLINTYKVEDNATLTQSFRRALTSGIEKNRFEFYNDPKGTIKIIRKDVDGVRRPTVPKTSKTKPVKTAAVEKKVSKPTSDKKTSTTKSTRKSTTKDTEKDTKATPKRATRSTTKSTEKSSVVTRSASKDVEKQSKSSTSPRAKTLRKKATKDDA
ncbi:22920_t:CDS:1 [Racocetra persica]|uniref:22920_t:CDS:1 n=1 Tax=Racocetra persica TaxID=160502 RepID=A0ACA9NJT2_9GLOM|nr:22920_t:CDS:1 [Racocetra persica]